MNGGQFDIDNLFDFEPYEADQSISYASSLNPSPYNAESSLNNVATMPSELDPRFTSNGQDEQPNTSSSSSGKGKGKGISIPMPIPSPMNIHSLLDASPSNAEMVRSPSSFTPSDVSSFGSSSYGFSSPASSSFSYYRARTSSPLSELLSLSPSSDSRGRSNSGKGKGRDDPPVLPPLTFYPTEIGGGCSEWMSFQASTPSSSCYSPIRSRTSPETPPLSPYHASTSPTSSATQSGPSGSQVPGGANGGVPFHLPTRCKSLSNLSVEPEAGTVKRVKLPTVQRPQSYLARKLAFVKQATPTPSRTTSPPLIDEAIVTPELLRYDSIAEGGNGRRVWYAASRLNENDTSGSRSPPPVSTSASEQGTSRPSSRGLLKHKGRSQSDPLPFSVLDYVPVTSTDVFEPLPLFTKNYFDDTLPREIHLHILRSFIQLHVDDHRRAVDSGRWSANRASASRNQWVGKDRGVRELVKLARVSKSWRVAVFDGQLWTDLDLRGLPKVPHHVIQRVVQSGGPFIQTLDFAGHVHMKPDHLIEMTTNLCNTVPADPASFTQLTNMNLQGCINLTTQSLHYLLMRSRALEKLVLKGLGPVTNTTCEILTNFCPNIVALNLSRCPNMDADGIRFMVNSAMSRREPLRVKELRLCGLKHPSDSMMEALGRVAPFLEVLDLSYVRQLRNSAIEAFVACDDEDDKEYWIEGMETMEITARDLGRDASTNSGRHQRRVTKIRHLNMSFCPLLTDTACSNLAYSVPRLEVLELAGLGADLKPAGLIRLLARTPFIRRLDLEDATDLNDAFLATITPVPSELTAARSTSRLPVGGAGDPPQPGHALQHLTVSYATQLGDQALLSLIRNCPKLTCLEADNTRIGSSVVREFVRLSKERRINNAKIVAVDCRGISESNVKELSGSTRPRVGWRSYAARKLHYLDGRDGNEDDLKIGQDECDESRVVLKTFYSWQTVDAVKANRERRRKSVTRRAAGGSSGVDDEEVGLGRTTRWWTPGGRRSGSSSPLTITDIPNEGCRTM